MGLKVRIKPGGSKIKLNPVVEYGTLNFDGSTRVAWTPTGIVDVSTYRTASFKMILDATSGYNYNGIFVFRNTDDWGDSFECALNEDYMAVDTGGLGIKYNLSDFPIGEVFDIEIQKSYKSIDLLKINGNIISSSGSVSGGGSVNISALGWSGVGDFYLRDAAVWDFKMYDGSSNLLNYFKGYPLGNDFNAWEDLVGNASEGNIAVAGGGDPTLREIEGTEGNISDLKNKIILVGSANPFDGFFARWDAGITSSLTVDGANRVSQWNDLINGWDVSEGTLGNQPTYDAVNDRVRFTRSSNQRLTRYTTPAVSQPITQVAVFECLTPSINQMITYGAGFRECGMWMQNSGPHLYMQGSGNTPVNKDGGGNITWATGEKFICIYKWDGASSRVYFEGDTTWTSGVRGGCSAGTNGITGIRLGWGYYSGDYFDGYLYELAYADYIVGDNSDQETAIIEHLRSKWNI